MVEKFKLLLSKAENLEKNITTKCIMAAILECINPFITLLGIDYIIEFIMSFNFKSAYITFIFMVLLKACFSMGISSLNFDIGEKKQMMYTDFKIYIRNIYLKLSYELSQSHLVRKMMNTVDYNCNMYGGLEEIVSLFQSILKNVLTVIISIISLAVLFGRRTNLSIQISFELFLEIVGIGLILTLVYAFIRKISIYSFTEEEKLYEAHKENEKSLNYFMTNFFCNSDTVKTIQQYNMKELILYRVKENVDKSIELFGKIRNLRLKEMLCHSIVNYLLSFCLYLILVLKTFYGAVGIGEFSFYYGVIMNFSATIAAMIDDNLKIKISISRLEEFLMLDKYCEKPTAEINNLKNLDDKKCIIEIKDVFFKYENSEKVVLNNINLKFNEGERIAIVGPNGAGKSTLVNCICGLLSVTNGEININGVNINTFDERTKRKFFGTVFQDYAYFPFTLGENVSIIENFDKEYVINLINDLNWNEEKLATEDNVDLFTMLSSGQKQKIAVARARYMEHSCYILDEPSASMDVLSEQKLFEEYIKITEGRLCILVSHKMASCKNSDKIVVMDKGEIIDVGGHMELLQRCNLYKNMWEKQSEHYTKTCLQ